MKFDSKLVHVGQEPDEGTGDVVPAIHIATTYEQRVQDPPRYFYGRGENPTRESLEAALAALEDARFATVYSSGQAAGAAVLESVRPGRRIVASDDVYGGTFLLLSALERRGVKVEYVDLTALEALDAAMADDVDVVWLETPTNPLLKVADVAGVAQRAHAAGARLVVDNTFATSVLQSPLELGADASLYSTTKFVAGHSDTIGGALVCNDEELHRELSLYRTAFGSVPGALDCYLVQRGLKTLGLRVRRQVENATRIAETLDAHPRVRRVLYPGLAHHPQYELATRQMSGAGAIVSFEYDGDVSAMMRRTELFACAVSLGSVRSLIECPATMTHRPIPADVRRALGIGDDLVRLAVGIEDPDDLVTDLVTALDGA